MEYLGATIITGGGKGLGKAIAFRMCLEGPVLLVGRTESALKETCEIITDSGYEANYLVADVTDPGSGYDAVFEVHCLGWAVRNLVCNAGMGESGPITDISPDGWHRMFNVNVHGTYHFIKACLPEMVKYRKGSISIISSIAAFAGFKNDSGYCATKAALNSIAESVSLEANKHGIPVAAICPGYVEGDMTTSSINNLALYKNITRREAADQIANRNIQKRILQPWEIAEAVAFLATPAAMPYSGIPIILDDETDARALKIVNWISKNAEKAKRLIVPVSGGSDSALALKLCSMAYPNKTIGVYFGEDDKSLQIDYLSFQAPILLEPSPEDPKDAEIDRWARLLKIAKNEGGWLVGSRNRTEETIGTYSMASRNATFLPIAGLWKSEVMELCGLVGVPKEITDSSRRADPNCGRPVEMAEIPLEIIDLYIQNKREGIPQSTQDYLSGIVKANKYKYFLPIKGPDLNEKTL
jgi:3-oxoacyl-[acyl-carrier protein] reductase